jgi:hypothetical protein
MKQRKHKISDKKLRGEWAEMHFMVRATDHGLPVSKPWGDSRSYDFVVGWPGHFVAVQVKSTIFELEEGGYTCGICGGGRKPYPPGSFDFLAAYIVFEDAWYIIPEEEILGMKSVSLHTNNSHSKYEKYRENWDLLQRAAGKNPAGEDPQPGHIDDMQGCADEFSTEWAEGERRYHSLIDSSLGG